MSESDKPALVDKRGLTRILIGALAITAVFFLFEKERPFIQVYKPLGLFLLLMVPAQIMLTRMRTRSST